MHDGSASLLWFVPAVLRLVPPFICSRAPVFCTLYCSRHATSIYLDAVATQNSTIPGFWAPGVVQHCVVAHQQVRDVSSQTPSRCSNAPTIAPLPTRIRIGGPRSLWTFPPWTEREPFISRRHVGNYWIHAEKSTTVGARAINLTRLHCHQL